MNIRRQPSEGTRRFAFNVRSVRAKRGLSQEQLAEAAGIHVTYISSLENGHRNPTLNVILALSRALETRPGILIESPIHPEK